MAATFSPLWILGAFILASFDSALCVQCPYNVGVFTSYKYCSTSCCGSMTARTCCETVNLGVLIPAVVGGCIVAFVLFIVFTLYYKKRVHKGRVVIGPSRNKTVTVSSTHPSVPVPPPAYTTSHYTSGPPPPPTGNPSYPPAPYPPPPPPYPPPPPPYPGHPVSQPYNQPHPAAYQTNTAVFI